MYIENGIEKLSKPQISKLLNGHRVRVKKGQGAKIHLTEEHSKKLHKAHLKGSGTTIQLDPYAIASNQHLRQAIAAAKKAVKHLMGGTALIDQPFTTRQAVNTVGNFVKDPAGTFGFGAHGGTALIDQPFTTRQAVNTVGNFVKDPAGTFGFGLKRRGRPKKIKGQGLWEDMGKVAKKAGKTVAKALANEVVQYAGPTAGAAFAAAATASGNPEFAPAAAMFGNELGSRAGNYANKRIQGMGLPKHRGRPRKVYSESPKVQQKKKIGRPRKGGAALPPGTPYGIY